MVYSYIDILIENKAKWFLIFLTILTGCATFTFRGVNVYNKQVDTPSVSDRQLKILMSFSFRKLGHLHLFDSYDFVFTSAFLAREIPGGKMEVADGFTDVENKVIYLKARSPCFADSAIIHEMAHVIHLSEKGNGDGEHTDKKYWDQVSVIEKEMIDKFCFPDYSRNDKIPTTVYK